VLLLPTLALGPKQLERGLGGVAASAEATSWRAFL
jgi:hypothetical protein